MSATLSLDLADTVSASDTSTNPRSKTMATATKNDAPARWTDAEVKTLMEAVDAVGTEYETKTAAYKAVAAKLGKSEGTVSQKHYNLTKGTSTKKRGRRSGPVSIKFDIDRIPFDTLTREDLDLLARKSDEELTRREVADEVAAKRAELEQKLAAELAKFEADAIKKAMAEAVTSGSKSE